MAFKKTIESVSGVDTGYQQVACFYAHHDGSVKYVVRRFVSEDTRDAGKPQVEERTFTIDDPVELKEIWASIHAKARKHIPELADAEDLFEPNGVTLDVTNISVEVGAGPTAVNATVTPDDAPDKSIEWTSSNESVAWYKNGKVYVSKDTAGNTTITARTVKRGKTASIMVTVTAKKTEEKSTE